MDPGLWKSQEELKKYLENLGTEYRYGCYSENNPETCHLLGDYFSSIEKKFDKAITTYRSNCDNNRFGLSCDAYARAAYRGLGSLHPDCKLALEYFTKGCDLGEPRSCFHGGQLLATKDKTINTVIAPDPSKALEMLDKACRSKTVGASCFLAHSIYLNGTHGHTKDLKKAYDYALMACDQAEPMGCMNLARMYHLGDGVDQDDDKSRHYRRRAKEILDGLKVRLDSVAPERSDL